MFTLDTSSLESAFLAYEKATDKDLPEILNRAGKNIAYRAAQFTDFATALDIHNDLFRDENLIYALTSIRLKKQNRGILPAPEFEKEVQKTLAARIGSSRYLRAAWAEAVEKFGGQFRGKRLHGASATVLKATVASLLTELTALLNEPDAKAQSAEDKMFPALQEAVDFVAEDMMNFATEKLQQSAKESGF